MRNSVISLVIVAAATMLVASGCGDEPCEPAEARAPMNVLKQLDLMNRKITQKIEGAGAADFRLFPLEEQKSDLMLFFPKVYGERFESVYDSLRALDDELDKARREQNAGKDPTDSLKLAKERKDALRKLLKESGVGVPLEVLKQLELMNAKIGDLIKKKGGEPEDDLIFEVGEEKRKLMSLFPKVYDVPFPDVYLLLKDINVAFLKAEGAPSTEARIRELERAKRKKEELEKLFRKGQCR